MFVKDMHNVQDTSCCTGRISVARPRKQFKDMHLTGKLQLWILKADKNRLKQLPRKFRLREI